MSSMQHNFGPGQNDQEELARFLRATESLLEVRVNERNADYNFLTVAGDAPFHPEFAALGTFSCTCNWNVCFAYNPGGALGPFDPAKMRFLCVFYTDDNVPVFLNDGRLWVDGNCGRLAIAFGDDLLHLKVYVDKRGKLTVRERSHPFSPKGYEKALQLLRKRQAVDGSRLPILTMLGTVPCTMDARTLQRALSAPR